MFRVHLSALSPLTVTGSGSDVLELIGTGDGDLFTVAPGGGGASLRRTAVGPFTIDEATSLDDVPDPLGPDHLISIDDALARIDAST